MEDQANMNDRYPLIYCASKLHRAEYWRSLIQKNDPRYGIVSTWHNSLTVEQDDASSNEACREGWRSNLSDLLAADALIAWATADEKPNGTIVEIGSMLIRELPVYLVGDFAWGTWRHLPFVSHHPSVEAALDQLLKDL